MTGTEEFRQEIRRLCPEGFLKRDRSPDALFVSDFPLRSRPEEALAALESAGYSCRIRDGLAHIALTPSRVPPSPAVSFTPGSAEQLYLYSLAVRLTRAGGETQAFHLPAFYLVFKALESGSTAEVSLLLPPMIAKWQRERRPLPGQLGGWLIHLLTHVKSGA